MTKVFGNDFNTKDGTCIRDFIHVKDIALAHIKSMEYLFENDISHIFNIGNGKGYSILDVIKTFAEINKINIPINFKERRKGDNPYLVACNKLAIKLLEWRPKKDLKDICFDCWRYANRNV